jgi:thiamine pyrophosphate-dependent acetolactate synthase large subunit-like protein
MDRRYFGVDFGSVDAVAVATAFGLKAHRVNTLEELRQVLERCDDGTCADIH